LGLKVHVGHVLGLEHDLGLGVDPSYKPCWDHITTRSRLGERLSHERDSTSLKTRALCLSESSSVKLACFYKSRLGKTCSLGREYQISPLLSLQ